MKKARLATILLLGILLVSGLACSSGEWRLLTYTEGEGTISPSTGTFPDGEIVTLTALPESGWDFNHWGGQASGSENPVNIIMDSDKTVSAYFMETTPTPTPSQVTKPTVGNIPQGWYLSDQDPYGTYDEYGTAWGLIEYTDNEDGDFVMIWYGDVPSELKGHETEGYILVEKAIEWSIFEQDETGTMVASGQIAGYNKRYDPVWEWNEMKIVFIMDSTCLDIYTIYDATSWDEAQAMSIINSISIK